ncbi:hypothetical protein [Komagataeibacter kakiaceti]|uniref:hypothetical protein n=1 Tax=Komagataeibacter kakiaceti TaxID=943261 RepID=UPI001F598F49|nr:hypothetical protein [Komagataeibacter kakiaceti]
MPASWMITIRFPPHNGAVLPRLSRTPSRAARGSSSCSHTCPCQRPTMRRGRSGVALPAMVAAGVSMTGGGSPRARVTRASA